ncbi:MAG: DUF4810 domain-containing protein [Treponema sp.]|nr:DUF4810 domain-containing protein [Treponema sp.]
MKNLKNQTVILIIIVLIFGFFLSGCVSSSLYTWGRYQDAVYAQLNGESPESQMSMMEKDLQKIASGSKPAPPGFYAHLGMLCSVTGDRSRAIEYFKEEKTRFPESTPFMNRLLSAYGE